MEHYRIGSTRAILSRSFCNTEIITDISEIEKIFKINMEKLQAYEEEVSQMPRAVLDKNRTEVKEIVERIVLKKRKAS